MADRGAKGYLIPSVPIGRVQIPVWADTPVVLNVAGSITITVADGGVPVNRARVTLYYRATRLRVADQITNSSGVCVFANLDTSATGAYYAVVLPPEQADVTPDFNALVFDHLSAV